MTKELLREEIKNTVKNDDITELELITTMQGICASKGDNKTLEMLIEIKREYIK